MADSLNINGGDFTGNVSEDTDIQPINVLETQGSVSFEDTENVLHVPVVDPVGTPMGTLIANILDDSSGAGDPGSVDWEYSIDNAAVQYLANGETLVEEFDLRIVGADGEERTQRLSITITGTNDAPTLTPGGTLTGAVTEVADVTGGMDELTATGSFDFVDLDLADMHSASVSTVGVTGSTTGLDLPEGTALSDLLTFEIVSPDAEGTVDWTFAAPDSAFDYLDDGETLTLTYTVALSDGEGGSVDQTITITITGSNDAPTATADTGNVVEAGTAIGTPEATGNVLTNDEDADGDAALSVSMIGASSVAAMGNTAATGTYGGLSIAADGSYTYTLDNGNATVDALPLGGTLSDEFTYTVTDENGETSTATLTITITGANDAPVVDAVTAAVDENATVTVTADFVDVDTDDTHTFGLDTTGTLGTVVNNEDGTYDYTAGSAFDSLAAGDTTTDTFTYSVTDANGAVHSNTVTVTITGTNDTPTVTADTTNAVTEAGAAGAGTDEVSGDASGGGANWVDVDTGEDAGLVITAAGFGDSAVTALSPDTIAPGSATNIDAQNLWSVASNIFVSDSGLPHVTISTASTNGAYEIFAVTLQAGERLTIDVDNSSFDTFLTLFSDDGTRVAVNDDGPIGAGGAGSELSGTFQGQELDSYLVYTATTAGTFYIQVGQWGSGFGSDAVGAPLPSGSQSFNLQLTRDIPGIPAGSPEYAYATHPDGLFVNPVGSENDTPPAEVPGNLNANGELEIDGTYGTLFLEANGEYRYVLDNDRAATQALFEGETQTETFTYEVSNGASSGDTTTGEIIITVNGRNDAPEAVAVNADGGEDESVTIAPDFTDVDLTDTHTISIAMQPASGVASVNEDGQIVFDPDGDFEYLDEGEEAEVTFTYTVTDNNGASDTATVTVTVMGANDAPVVSGAVTATVSEGSGIQTVNPIANVTDADGEGAVVIIPLTLPAGVSFASADTISINFEDYALGSVVGQNGWTDASPSSPANAIVDVAGDQMLWLANDPSSGDFGGPYAPSLEFNVGENITGADGDTMSFSFTIRAVSAVADGSRMEIDFGQDGRDDRFNFMAIEYVDGGLRLVQSTPTADGNWTNDSGQPANFNFGTGNVELIAGLDPTVDHTIEVRLRTVDGLNNDVIEFWVNGDLVGTGGSFENFYANFTAGWNPANYAVNTILFRAGEAAGNPFPADGAGPNRQGFLIDDVTLSAYDSQTLQIDTNDPAYDYLAAGEELEVVVNYDVTDGTSTTAASTVFTVVGTNDAPEAEDVTGEAEENGAAITIAPIVNDVDLTDTHTILIASQPADGGVASVDEDGNIVFDPNGEFEYLAEGEEVEVTFTYTANDGNGGIDTGTVTVTITGSNDAPTLTAGVVLGTTNEPVGLTGPGLVAPLTGTFDVADVDTNGQTEMEVTFGSLTTNYGARQASGLTQDQIDGLVAALTVTPLMGNDGTVTWTFAPDNSVLDFIRFGETLTVVLNVNVDDGEGGTAVQPITITINGSNDTIFAGDPNDLTGEVDEPVMGDATATGSIQYDDADFTNHVALVTRVAGSSTISGGTLTTTISDQALDDGSGQVDWTYTIGADDTDSLAAGETRVEVFQIRIVGTASDELVQNVTVTITGTNDAPIIDTVVGDFTGAVTEETDATDGEGVLEASGSISFGDVDLLDLDADADPMNGVEHSVAVTVVSSGVTSGGPIDEELTSMLTTTVTQTGAMGTGGAVDWDFAIDDAAVDYLAEGEELTLTYTLTVTDSHGGTDSQDVVITITGTNDAPVVTTWADPLNFSEDAVSSAQGWLQVADVDATDSHVFTVVGTAPAGFTLNPNGSFELDTTIAEYQNLAQGATMDVVVTYIATDDSGAANAVSNEQTVTITVTGTNDGPVAVVDTGTLTENVGGTFNLVDNDTDVDDGAVLTLSAISLGSVAGLGMLTTLEMEDIASHFAIASNALVFTPPAGLPSGLESVYDRLSPGETATVTINYTVSDEFGATSTSTFTLTINGAGEAVTGTPGVDILIGTSLDDAINGLGGNDTLLGEGGDDTILGGSGVDSLLGGDGDDTLFGESGNDTLVGGEGNDMLNGGTGIDSMIGGNGDDTYFVDNVGDVVTEFVGEGTDTVNSSLNAYTLGANVEHLNLISATNASGTGNTLDNTITGNDGNNLLSGLSGNDTLIGGGGNDSLYGRTGADIMIGGTGNDTYYVENVGDVVTELAGEGIDTVSSTLSYELGDNVERLLLSGSTAINGTGNELDNFIRGNTGSNILSGMEGNDTIYGGGGDDVIIGGAGRDNLYGDAGADRFVFADGDFSGATAATADAIRDFSQTQGDIIDLSLVDGIAGEADSAFTFIGTAGFSQTAGELRYVVGVGFTTVQGDMDGDGVADFWIRMTGEITLDESDFWL